MHMSYTQTQRRSGFASEKSTELANDGASTASSQSVAELASSAEDEITCAIRMLTEPARCIIELSQAIVTYLQGPNNRKFNVQKLIRKDSKDERDPLRGLFSGLLERLPVVKPDGRCKPIDADSLLDMLLKYDSAMRVELMAQAGLPKSKTKLEKALIVLDKVGEMCTMCRTKRQLFEPYVTVPRSVSKAPSLDDIPALAGNFHKDVIETLNRTHSFSNLNESEP